MLDKIMPWEREAIVPTLTATATMLYTIASPLEITSDAAYNVSALFNRI